MNEFGCSLMKPVLSIRRIWSATMCGLLMQLSAIAQDMAPPTFWRWSSVLVKTDGDCMMSTWAEDSVQYSLIFTGDDTLLRAQFQSQESIEVLVKRHWAVDTAYTESLSTGDMTMVVSSYACWIPGGVYTRFHSDQRIPALRGKLLGQVPDGMWSEYDETGRLLREYFLTGGWPSGEYREYHLNGAVSWDGSYCDLPKRTWVESLYTGEMISEVQMVHEKCGTWTRSNPDGKKVLRVTYDWVSE